MLQGLFAQMAAPLPRSAVSATPPPSETEALKGRARRAAQEFESVFLTAFIEQMQSEIDTDGPFGGGHAEKIYRSMMADQYARSIAQSGGVGIADQVYAEILRSQELER